MGLNLSAFIDENGPTNTKVTSKSAVLSSKSALGTSLSSNPGTNR